MSAFDKECPRCHGKGLPKPQPPAIPPASPPPVSPPPNYPPQQSPYPQQPPVVVQQNKGSGFSTGLGGGVGAGIGCCCLFPVLIFIVLSILGGIGANVSKNIQNATPVPTTQGPIP